MRVAVISDIHGNRLALDSALADMAPRSMDTVVCLGDTLQGGPQPKQTVEKLKELKCPIVMGNADAWLLDKEGKTAEPTTREQHEVREWTLSKLSADDLDFIRGYKPLVRLELGGSAELLCFHGSPTSYDEVLLPETPLEEWDRILGPYSPSIMTGGHTHTQQIRRVREGLFFNPGSVGLAYNYSLPKDKSHLDPWAEYAILTYDNGLASLEFHRARYDLEALVDAIKASGRPHSEDPIRQYTAKP
jgi:predicted phosphodiesterase